MSNRAAWIPESHIKQLSLQKHGRATWAVYALILAQRNYSTGTFEGLQSELAFDLGLSIRSIINAEQELQQMGMIQITKNGRGRVIQTLPPTHAGCFTNTCRAPQLDHYKKDLQREKDRAHARKDEGSSIFDPEADPYGPEFDKPF